MSSEPANWSLLPERLLRSIAFEPTTGCWLWITPQSTTGYGNVRYERRVQLTHRLVYKLLRGDIPAPLTLDHLCRTPCCCNPDHLEPVSHLENMRRANCPIAANALAERCAVGHEFSIKNVRRGGKRTTRRYCKTCTNAHRKYMRQIGRWS